jgi:hypothetical protein
LTKASLLLTGEKKSAHLISKAGICHLTIDHVPPSGPKVALPCLTPK